MPGKKKERKDKEPSKIFYVKAESVADVCRRACSFSFNVSTILLSEVDGKDALIDMGSMVNKTQLAYYADAKETGSVAIYEPAGDGRDERVAFADRMDVPNKHYINVVRVDLSTFERMKEIDPREVQAIRVGSQFELVRSAIGRAAKDEQVANIYAFSLGGKKVLAAFEIIAELSNDKPMFYYTTSDSRVLRNFARYDYRNNTMDFSDSMADHTYLYAKIINLEEPFPFLKKI